MIKHIRRWNLWRKDCLNGKIYIFLVLVGVATSPSLQFILLPEERPAIHRAFMSSEYWEDSREVKLEPDKKKRRRRVRK